MTISTEAREKGLMRRRKGWGKGREKERREEIK